MFNPDGPVGTVNLDFPVDLLATLVFAFALAFSEGALALAATVAIGAGGLGGGGGGGGGLEGAPPIHINTLSNSNTIIISL